MHVEITPYPNFKPAIFTTTYPTPIAEINPPVWLTSMLNLAFEAPVSRAEERRTQVRDLLRHEGYKPTGRGKPAAEYLVKAAENDRLGSINTPVDACNVVSLHSGLPISVVDLDLLNSPLVIKTGSSDDSYVFNQSGQEISIAGLLCLHDEAGPCANAVKDSQRTKTSDSTTQTLSIIWGLESLADQVDASLTWYLEIIQKLGATTKRVA